MKITDILAKLLKGETLTDEEKTFAAAFDADKITNDAAAAARRKAQTELGTAQAEIERLKAELAAAKEQTEGRENTQIAKLQKTVDNLNASLKTMQDKAAKAEAEAARVSREQAIANYASANGIKAANGVKEAAFLRFFRDAVGDADLANEAEMKAVVDAFRADFAGIIASGGVKVPNSGSPATGNAYTGENPFKSGNITKQYEVFQSNPDLARQLAAEAGQTI